MFLGYVVCDFFQIIGNLKNFTNMYYWEKFMYKRTHSIQIHVVQDGFLSLHHTHTHTHTHTYTYTIVYICILYIHVQLCMYMCVCDIERETTTNFTEEEIEKKFLFLNSFKISCRSHGSWYFMMLTENVGR